MDLMDSFISENTTPTRRDLLMHANELLITLGYTDHELDIENVIGVQGSLDNSIIVSIIENDLLVACEKLALKYFIVTRQDNDIRPYIHLFDFLSYLENTIDSETLLHYYNEELSALDQFNSWVDVFRTDLSTQISDLVLDVMPSLIENIVQSHELKVEHVPIERDEKFHSKIRCLKHLRSKTAIELLAIRLVKDNKLKTLLSVEDMAERFKRALYALNSASPQDTTLHLLSIVIMTTGDVSALCVDAKKLLHILYDDLTLTNKLSQEIDEYYRLTGELCEIMSTI